MDDIRTALNLFQVDEPEKVILDSKEKIEFYRTKMQDLVSSFYYLIFTLIVFVTAQSLSMLGMQQWHANFWITKKAFDNLVMLERHHTLFLLLVLISCDWEAYSQKKITWDLSVFVCSMRLHPCIAC